MPQPPLQYENTITLDLSDLSSRMHQAEEQRQSAYDLSRQIQVALVQATLRVGQQTNNESSPMSPLHELVRSSPQLLLNTGSSYQRLANLQGRVEAMIRLEAYHYFLQTGRLVALSTLEPVYSCTDEEYLAGACMGLAQELQRYGLGRATVRDVTSVQQAANLMSEIQNYLLELDFRNGPLRRKFDGTKYCLKALETLLYELAVTGSTDAAANSDDNKDDAEEEPANKKIKSSDNDAATSSSSLIPVDELQALKDRMNERDQMRETLIKSCRDGQKAAKQAIFALHRGAGAAGRAKARQLMQTCRNVIQSKLVPVVTQEPSLQTAGPYVGVLEEYAEARLFAAWLYGKEDWLVVEENDANNDKDSTSAPAGILLELHDFTEVSLEPEQYLGGLCDLTGEVGRFAVQRGTVRDVAAVQLCLQTNMAVHSAMQSVERLPSHLNKKMDSLRQSVSKIERMLYEMSLSQAAGGRHVKTDMDVVGVDNNKGDDLDNCMITF